MNWRPNGRETSLRIRSDLPGILRLVFWALFGVYIAVWLVSTLSWPFARDQGILAWAGSVVRGGGVLYRDAWEVKGPAGVLPFTIAQVIFGHNMWGIRLIDLLITLCGIGALAVIAQRVWDRQAAIYAVALAALFTASLNFATAAQPDTWCACAIAVCIAALTRRADALSFLRIAATASVMGVCSLQKPVYAIYLLLYIPLFSAASLKPEFRKRWAAVAIGFLVPILAAAAWFAAQHSLGYFFDTYILFNLRAHLRVQNGSPEARIQLFFFVLRSLTPLTIGLPFAVLGAVALQTRRHRFAAVYWCWLALDLALIAIQGKYFEYQWISVMQPVALGAGFALRQIRESGPPVEGPRRALPSPAGFVFLAIAPIILSASFHSMKTWALDRAGRMSPAAYDAEFTYLGKDNYDFAVIRRIAAYLDSHSSPGDAVEVWGFDAVINYLSDRPSPTRFGYVYPLNIGEQNPYQASYRAEFMDRLRSHPPVYVLVTSGDSFGLTAESSQQALERFTELRDFVSGRYRLETTIGNWSLYRARIHGAGADRLPQFSQ